MFINQKDIDVTFLLIFIIILLLLFYNRLRHNFWSTRGVPGPKLAFYIGNVAEICFKNVPRVERMKKLYNSTDAPYIGFYRIWEPVLLLRDPNLIKYILQEKFHSFGNRGVVINEKLDPLAGNLYNLEFERWMYVRSKLTPIFTSDMMKSMFPRIEESGNHLHNEIRLLVETNDVIECRELIQKYTFNVIASCLLGIDVNKMAEKKEIVREIVNRIFTPNKRIYWCRQIGTLFPVLTRLFKTQHLDKCVSDAYLPMLQYIFEFRKYSKTKRNDLINLLMTCKENDKNFDWTLNLIAAQCFILVAAGMRTSGSIMCYALEELAKVPTVQEKLRDEILETVKRCNGKVTFDSLLNMKYLHRIVQETLRKHSPLTELKRESTEYCSLPDGLQLPPSVKISIPIRGIHSDPKYYENPEAFDPDRFTEEACRNRPDMSFIPFGYGPRNCIGSRLACLQTKMALLKVFEKYRVSVKENTNEAPGIADGALLLRPANGVSLKISPWET